MFSSNACWQKEKVFYMKRSLIVYNLLWLFDRCLHTNHHKDWQNYHKKMANQANGIVGWCWLSFGSSCEVVVLNLAVPLPRKSLFKGVQNVQRCASVGKMCKLVQNAQSCENCAKLCKMSNITPAGLGWLGWPGQNLKMRSHTLSNDHWEMLAHIQMRHDCHHNAELPLIWIK